MCDNTWDSNSEPGDVCHGCTVSWEVFYTMMKPLLNGIAEDDMLAILKRTVVIIAGYRAVYMRMPSEKKDEPIKILTLNDVASNWFQQSNSLPVYQSNSLTVYQSNSLTVYQSKSLTV